MSKLKSLAATAAAILVLAGCTIYHEAQYQSISAKGWALTDEITFKPSPDSIAWTQIHLRTSEHYPFTQLVIELTCDSVVDTLCISIAPAARMQPAHSAMAFPRPISKPITLRHIMTTDTLRGVHEIGLE